MSWSYLRRLHCLRILQIMIAPSIPAVAILVPLPLHSTLDVLLTPSLSSSRINCPVSAFQSVTYFDCAQLTSILPSGETLAPVTVLLACSNCRTTSPWEVHLRIVLSLQTVKKKAGSGEKKTLVILARWPDWNAGLMNRVLNPSYTASSSSESEHSGSWTTLCMMIFLLSETLTRISSLGSPQTWLYCCCANWAFCYFRACSVFKAMPQTQCSCEWAITPGLSCFPFQILTVLSFEQL